MSTAAEQHSLKKNSGSYYTPQILADFIVKHVSDSYLLPNLEGLRILEPSCGDGEFIKSILKSHSLNQSTTILHACEIDKTESDKTFATLAECNDQINYKVFNQDFLDFFKNSNDKYDLVIGNPPYIDKRRLSKNQLIECKLILDKIGVDSNVKNLWPVFVLAASVMLKEQGTLAFVLPAELLQVNYTGPIRQFLLNYFNKIDIFAFNELIFDGIEQDVVILVATRNKSVELIKGISFYQVNSLIDLLIPEYVKKHTNIHRKSLNKWTNYVLSDEDLDFIDSIKNQMNPIKYFCSKVEVGIVTGANHYFILDKEKVKSYNLESSTEKILTKGGAVSNTLFIDESTLAQLDSKKTPYLLFKTPDFSVEDLNEYQVNYINKGVENKVDVGYKCAKRKNWYCVPSIWKSSALFIKRTNIFPRIVINNVGVLATDSFYRIETLNSYDCNVLAFSFYNTITFIISELEGRYYGGGVLELTPNEFKNLPIPYNENVSSEEINYLDKLIRTRAKLEQILDYTDKINLNAISGISPESLVRLRSIYMTLLRRRLKSRAFAN